MKKLVAAIGFSLVASVAVAQTETQYVIEQLVVSVTATADGSGDRVGQVKSGDRVEVLERDADQARVRLSSGEEGWLRSSYLSSTPPLREQLKARTEELEKLRQEKTKLEADLASARKAASASSPAATAAVAAVTSAPPPAAVDVAPPAPQPADSAPQSSNPPLFSSEGVMPSRPSWLVALIACLATLIVGFVMGWRMLDKRIREKYGGLRIY